MRDAANPLSQLDPKELKWLFGILKDACRERLEKNLVNQAFEERLHRRGAVAGRLDPRPFLELWEPRYRKLLEVATEIHGRLESGEELTLAETLRAHFNSRPTIRRRGPDSAHAMIGKNADIAGRKSRTR